MALYIQKISDEKIAIILQEPLLTSTEIEKQYGIPASTVRRYRKLNGIVFRQPFNPSKEDFITVAKECKNNVKEIAKHYKVDKRKIYSFADQIGYTIRKRKLSQNEINQVVDLYDQYSSTKVAEMFGVTPACISGVWCRNNLNGKSNRTYHIGNETLFQTIDKESAYLLGFIGADGCLYHPKDVYKNKQDILQISIRHEDIKILELFKQKLDTDKPISKYKEYVSLEISSNIISQDLQKLGISYNKTYSNSIANISDEYMPDLIRGYLDGDGSIGSNVSISGYYKNINKLISFLNNYNIFASFTRDKRKYQNDEDNPFGALTISNKTSEYSFLKLIYKDCGNYYMDRKKEIADAKIRSIENSDNVRDKQIVVYYNYAVCKKAS